MTDWQAAAGAALSSLWKTEVTCAVIDTLVDEGRNRVFRMGVTGGPVSSVILKASIGDEQTPYTVGDDLPGRPFCRFCNEWAGCAMLAPLGLGPKVYTGNAERGFYLMEDLGAGVSLADKLTGDNPEAATTALFAYARSLGQLHAATRDQQARWHKLRTERGGTKHRDATTDSWRREMAGFRNACEQHAISVPHGLEKDVLKVGALIENPGAYSVFTPADCCPDNHYLRGDRVIFFDCEGATCRHALLDAAYFIVPFPSCWCTSRLPAGMPARLLGAYREHFAGEADFDEQLTIAAAGWIFPPLMRTLTSLDKPDQKWGLVTIRQRHLDRLENLLARPNFTTTLPALAEVSRIIHTLLKARWPEVEPMPLYPAFRTMNGSRED